MSYTVASVDAATGILLTKTILTLFKVLGSINAAFSCLFVTNYVDCLSCALTLCNNIFERKIIQHLMNTG